MTEAVMAARLALMNIAQIAEEVAKLRARVEDHTFDSRSIVGDAVLRMEPQLHQAQEHLKEIIGVALTR